METTSVCGNLANFFIFLYPWSFQATSYMHGQAYILSSVCKYVHFRTCAFHFFVNNTLPVICRWCFYVRLNWLYMLYCLYYPVTESPWFLKDWTKSFSHYSIRIGFSCLVDGTKFHSAQHIYLFYCMCFILTTLLNSPTLSIKESGLNAFTSLEFSFSLPFCILELGILINNLHCEILYSYQFALWNSVNHYLWYCSMSLAFLEKKSKN